MLIKLIRNGMKSMQGQGGILIVTLRAWPKDGALIEISDQGASIPPAFSSRLLDPFPSPHAEGIGMGLNICRSIVEQHHGQRCLIAFSRLAMCRR